jgi:hypothetical protein
MASAFEGEIRGLCAGMIQIFPTELYAETFSEPLARAVQVRLHGPPKHKR